MEDMTGRYILYDEAGDYCICLVVEDKSEEHGDRQRESFLLRCVMDLSCGGYKPGEEWTVENLTPGGMSPYHWWKIEDPHIPYYKEAVAEFLKTMSENQE